MHEDLLERRLSAALHDEADSLPLTISAAELERRLALRHRSSFGRRLTLLLAAAVGMGLVGVGGALGGWFNPTLPAPAETAVSTSRPVTSPPVALDLPSLDELVAVSPETVLVAQAHGPGDGPAPQAGEMRVAPAKVVLGTFRGGTDYRLGIACRGAATVVLDISVPGGRGPESGPTIGCNGSVHEESVSSADPRSIAFRLTGPASWRVVVRGSATAPPAQADPIPPLPEGQQELVRADEFVMDAQAPAWTSGLLAQNVGALPPRERYDVRMACAGAPSARFFLGDTVDGELVADTETQIGCGAPPGEVSLGVAQPAGSQVFIAAHPGQAVSLVVASDTPPVALTQKQANWHLEGGLGPEYAFERHTMSFGGAGVGYDRVWVFLACTGTEPIDVTVEDGSPIGARTRDFQATCEPDGSTTGVEFSVSKGGVGVSYVAPVGSWTALSILVPNDK